MNILFIMLFIFAFGCVFGWILELIFKRIAGDIKQWSNPGFLIGPYLPVYGFGLSVLYIIANLEKYIPCDNAITRSIIIFIVMGIAMTLVEYIAGIIFIKRMKIKLWDYSDMWGNVQGIICPLFSFFWVILGVIYYYALHPYITYIVTASFKSVVTYFTLGMFYGVFLIDIVYSMQLMSKIKQFAQEHQIVVKLEELKENIRKSYKEQYKKIRFFRILTNENFVSVHLKQYHEKIEKVKNDLKTKIKKTK